MKAYILTVRLSNDVQLCNLVERLQFLGFDVEVITGILGARMEAGEYFAHAAKVYSRHGYLLSPGELACTLGHLEIYERIVSGDSSHAFVFEDDVILGDDTHEIHRVIEFLKETSSNFVHLGGQEGISYRFKIRGYPYINFDRFISVPTAYLPFLNRTCGYVISQDYASKLLCALSKCPFKIDDFRSVARVFSVESLDFIDAISHPQDLRASLIEAERALISGSNPNGGRLFLRIWKEVRLSIGVRFGVFMRRYAEWRNPTVSVYSKRHD